MAVSRAEVPQHRSRGKERRNSALGFHTPASYGTLSLANLQYTLWADVPTYLARFGGVSLAASLVSICSNVASPRFCWYVWPTLWEETVRLTFG
jgi:hypothetical protein